MAAGYTTDYDAAEAFGVDRSFVSRFRNGTLRGGNHILAGMALALEDDPGHAWLVLPKLFVITRDGPA